jgi:hypothetical protein
MCGILPVAIIDALGTSATYATSGPTPPTLRPESVNVSDHSVEGQQPVLIVWEDVHWCDPTARESLDLLIDRVVTLRMLMIFIFRAEFAPPWIDRPHVIAHLQSSAASTACRDGRAPNWRQGIA